MLMFLPSLVLGLEDDHLPTFWLLLYRALNMKVGTHPAWRAHTHMHAHSWKTAPPEFRANAFEQAPRFNVAA